MSATITTLLLSSLFACGPKVAPQAAADPRATRPAPLAARPFQLADAVDGTLSNGLKVVVVENHEVPLVYVNVAFKAGSWTDPAGKPGIASATMDMLNEGAAGMTASELSAAARKLGVSLNTGASLDGASVTVSGLTDKLPDALQLMAKVMLQPDFPQADWELMQKKRLQDLAAARNDPSSIASRTWAVLGYGNKYAGHLTTETAVRTTTTDDMRTWYDSYIAPQHAIITVGGDITLAQVQPLLEATLGQWTTAGAGLPAMPSADALPKQAQTRIFLVDKPGAAQSMLRVGAFVGSRQDADYWSFRLANMAIGGMFTARINMNLREDKGWTYGARSWIDDNYLPSRWTTAASVVTSATADSVSEIQRELSESLASRPITSEEVDNGRGYLLGTWPVRFENAGALMSETVGMWRYDLPADWLKSTPDAVRAVTVDQAKAAWSARIDPTQVDILVVGDAAVVRPGLEALGLPIVNMLPDGKPAPVADSAAP